MFNKSTTSIKEYPKIYLEILKGKVDRFSPKAQRAIMHVEGYMSLDGLPVKIEKKSDSTS